MYDPEIDLDKRLKAELGIRGEGTYEKNPNDELELKFRIKNPAAFDHIRDRVHSHPNRLVDTRAWTRNPYVLVTLNLDTEDRLLAREGYSLRVRFALDRINGVYEISSIDMCIKSVTPESNLIRLDHKRGEWETDLPTLRPNMARMIAANQGTEPPLPDFFKSGLIKDEDLFVESIGCTLRCVYPSYESFNYKGQQIASVFQHTEDRINLFMTPHADIITGEDSEAEAEFIRLMGITPHDLTPEKFQKLQDKALDLLNRQILLASPGNIEQNRLSKAIRARHALETFYGPSVADDTPSRQFDRASQIAESSHFSLSQRIRPEAVMLDNIWRHVGHLHRRAEKEIAPQEQTFTYK